MNKSQLIFKAIDIAFDKSQNPYNIDNIYRIKNIAYNNKDEDFTCGDFYFDPIILKDGKKHPVILNIHGGGFVEGDKKYRKTLSEIYAGRGYYVYNINYRMPPETDLFGGVNDVIDAINHILVLAEEYSIDLDKVVVTGDSSGAYLSSYIAAMKFNPEIADSIGLPQVKPDIAALILHSGPYDMKKMMRQKLPFGIIHELASMLIGYELKEDLSDIVDYKYYDYISTIDMVNNKWCPTFISWSDSDFICEDQGRPMAEKLMKHCPKVSTFYTDGLANGHCFHMSIKKDVSMQCIENSLKFIESVFDEMDNKVTA